MTKTATWQLMSSVSPGKLAVDRCHWSTRLTAPVYGANHKQSGPVYTGMWRAIEFMSKKLAKWSGFHEIFNDLCTFTDTWSHMADKGPLAVLRRRQMESTWKIDTLPAWGLTLSRPEGKMARVFNSKTTPAHPLFTIGTHQNQGEGWSMSTPAPGPMTPTTISSLDEMLYLTQTFPKRSFQSLGIRNLWEHYITSNLSWIGNQLNCLLTHILTTKIPYHCGYYTSGVSKYSLLDSFYAADRSFTVHF